MCALFHKDTPENHTMVQVKYFQYDLTRCQASSVAEHQELMGLLMMLSVARPFRFP